MLTLAGHGRLTTRDGLARWGVTADQICPLCSVENESVEHLFFRCD